ncbi:MAG: DUF4998 domain-containing protein [Draconibacterium sp.]
MRNILIIIVALLVIAGCEDQDYLHQKYLDEGEITYIGKSGFVQLRPGRYRLEAVWQLSNDPKALYTVIEIEDDSITLFNSDYSTVDSFLVTDEDGNDVRQEFAIGRYIIENLDEKDYTLKFYQKDNEGNTSLKTENFTTVYGTKYEEALINQSISSITYIDNDIVDEVDSVKVIFNNSKSAVGFIITYQSVVTGQNKTIILPKGSSEVVLAGTKRGGEFQYSTRYLPTNGIDTVQSGFKSVVLPYPAIPDNS